MSVRRYEFIIVLCVAWILFAFDGVSADGVNDVNKVNAGGSDVVQKSLSRENKAPSLSQLRQLLKLRKSQAKKSEGKSGSKIGISSERKLSGKTLSSQPSHPASKFSELTKISGGDKYIQFSFDNAPYSAVFDFVEKITNLPILGDRNVPGTVTYFSRKKMTINEALEELNLLLKDKGVVLIRTDGHLRISKFPDALRGYSRDFIGADAFLNSDVPPNQVVRVFFRVRNLPADELTNLLAEAVPINEVKLAAWKTTNYIQVVGLADRVRQIVKLARRLDDKLTPFDTNLLIKIYHPHYMSASSLEKVLRAMLPSGGVLGSGAVPLGKPTLGQPKRYSLRDVSSGNYRLVADDASGILVIRASEELLEHIEKLIDKIDLPPGTDRFQAKTIAIKFGSVQTIASAIAESIKRQVERPGKEKQYVSVKADKANNSIVIVGPASFIKQAESLVSQLDRPGIKTNLQVIALQNASVGDIVKNILKPYYSTAKRPMPVAADIHSNTIITWASGAELKELKSLLNELDNAVAEGKGIPAIRTYRLDDVDTKQLVAALTYMFGKDSNIKFSADPASHCLIVAAPLSNFPKIEKLIEQFKVTLSDKRITRLVELKYANAQEIAKLIKSTYGAKRISSGGLAPRIEVSANVQANSIVISGAESIVKDIEHLVDRIDKSVQSKNKVKAYHLKYADAVELVKIINDLYGKQGKIKAVPEPWSNSIFVTGVGIDMSAVDQLIRTADSPEPASISSSNVAFIQLKTASAEDVASQIQSVLGESDDSKKHKSDMPVVSASSEGNYLIVTGKPAQIERVRKYAEQFDKMARQLPEVLAVRPIQKASAQRIAQMLLAVVPQLTSTDVRLANVDISGKNIDLNKLLVKSSSQPGRPAVTIGVDKTNNVLIVKGRPRDIKEIDKIIENLTSNIEGDVQFKIYKLTYASPYEVAQNLEMVFNEVKMPQLKSSKSSRSSRRTRILPSIKYRIRAIPAPSMNAVIVRADPRDDVVVKELIKQLDVKRPGNIRVFKLKYARADAVARNISEVFGSSRSSRRGIGGGISLKTLIGGQWQSPVRVSFDLSSNSVIVSADKAQMSQIEQIINTVDKPEVSGMDVYVLSIKSGRAEKLAPMVQRVIQRAEQMHASQLRLKPSPLVISADRRTNSLIIAGSMRQFQQVKKLVMKLEQLQPAGSKRIYIVPLKNIDPNRAKRILEQILPQTQSRANSYNMSCGYVLSDALMFSVIGQVATRSSQSVRMGVTTRPASAEAGGKAAEAGEQSEEKAGGRAEAGKKEKTEKSRATRPASSERIGVSSEGSALNILKGIINASIGNKEDKRDTKEKISGKAEGQKSVYTRGNIAKLELTSKDSGYGAGSEGKRLETGESLSDIKSLAAQIKGDVEITAMPEQGALIISASEEDYKVIAEILTLLDMAGPSPIVKIYKLKNTQAKLLEKILNKLFAHRKRPRGFPRVDITADPATNSIVVSADANMMSEIERVIKELDSTEQIPEIEYRTFTLQNARANEVVPKIQGMLKQILASRGIDAKKLPFSITADERTNTILVTAPKTYLEQFARLISVLDSVPSYATVEMEIVRLKRANADSLGALLNSLISAQMPQKKTSVVSGRRRGWISMPLSELSKGQSRRSFQILKRLKFASEREGKEFTLDLEKPILFLPDSSSQSIAILSTKENIAAIKQIIGLFDRVPISEDVKVRVFPLLYADASEVVKELRNLFKQGKSLTQEPGTGRKEGVPENLSGSAVVYNVALSADERTNTIIASGRESSIALIDVLISQLDKNKPVSLYPIKIITLKNASALDISKLIKNIMDRRLARAKALGVGKSVERQRTIIGADTRTNSILISASDETFSEIRKIVDRLDSSEAAGFKPVLITLKNIDAEETAKVLRDFFKQQVQAKKQVARNAQVSPAPVIVADATSNSLLICATAENLNDARRLIKRMDSMPVNKTLQVAVIPLKSADANELARAIMGVLNPSKGQKGLRQSVMLEFLKKTPKGAELITRAHKDLVYIYGEKTSNLLIAMGPADTIKLIRSLAEEIDQVAPSVNIRIFALENADASQMKKTIEDLFGIGKSKRKGSAPISTNAGLVGSKLEHELLSVTADSRTNSLIVTGTKPYLDLIADMVEKLDAKAVEEQKTEVISLRNADPENIAKSINSLIENRIKLLKEVYGKDIAPERILEQQVNIVADKDSRKVILQASPRYFDKIKHIISELDEPPSQVMIQALLVDVRVSNNLEYGFEAVGQDLAFTKASNEAGTPGIGPNHDIIVGTDIGAAGSGALAGFTFALNGEDFNLLLRALQVDGKLQILSRPQIMARDNVEAEIQIGQRVPYPTGSTTSSDTGNITTQIQYEDIGIILKVTPHINPDGYVILDVAPEISSISDSTVQISEGLNATVFNKTKASTTVAIKDGETIVIGGLFRTEKRHRENKVPFLGDIPILGYLFKSLTNVDEKTELLIVLTPKLVDDVEKAREISSTERDMLDLLPKEVRESELMGKLRVEPEYDFYPTSQPAYEDGNDEIRLFPSPETQPSTQATKQNEKKSKLSEENKTKDEK